MSTAWVECWKCDECGHRWIKTEIWPAQCASSKCRKRSWNKNAAAGRDESSKPNVLPSGTYGASMGTCVKSPAEAKEPQPAPILPDVKMNDAMAGLTPEDEIENSREMCSYQEYDQDTGETYGCRLSAHPAKIKHQRGPAL